MSDAGMDKIYDEGEVLYVLMFGKFAGMFNTPPLHEDGAAYNYITDYMVCEWGFYDTEEYVDLYPGDCTKKSLQYKTLYPSKTGYQPLLSEDGNTKVDDFVTLYHLEMITSYVKSYKELLGGYRNEDLSNVWIFPSLSEIKKLDGFENVTDDELFFCR